MRLAIWVNDAHDIRLSQTTAMLIAAAEARGHEVWISGVNDLGLDPRGRVVAMAWRPVVPKGQAASPKAALGIEGAQLLDMLTVDGVLIRTNPGRGGQGPTHEVALGLAELLQQRNVGVLNDPAGLRKAASKLFLAGLPAHLRPQSVVGGQIDRLRSFVESSAGFCVAKPLVGTRGQGVFKVSKDDPNLQAILTTLTADGPALVQEYLPEAGSGDLRLIVLDGEPLALNGNWACVQRVPASAEWRSNIHLGGTPTAGAPSEAQLAAGRELGKLLLAEGIVLAGLDLIGALAVEVNVFSTGGLRDANAFSKCDFCTPILDSIERRLRAPRVPSSDAG